MNPRIVSLIPSATEILCAMGFQTNLVGISHECDFPLDLPDLPKLPAPNFIPDGTSYEIDERVKAILAEGLAVYRVDADLLKELKPTHIITQSQCDVCAVSLKEIEKLACSWVDQDVKVVSLQPDDIDCVYQDIHKIGEALGENARAKALIDTMGEGFKQISERVPPGAPLNVLCIEWLEPLMDAGNWVPELLEMVGGKSSFGKAGEHSDWIQWEQILESNPDYILLMPCGFSIERTKEELVLLTKRDGIHNLKAYQSNQIYLCDGNQYFNRPGPRLVDSLQILAEILHSSDFGSGLQGIGFIPLSEV